ncbi:MAG: low temperature requirement protein A [Gaiellaceae bacterium MAG52_C11]|nr:low temperature requirement protein A [Candidatus Gaiellasilicea maunaloa]
MEVGPVEPVERDKQVEPLELFFDLVFVFALTQVTARLADDPSWGGLLRGLFVLAGIWWTWGAYAWLTNEVDSRQRGVRLAMLASMTAMLVAALAIPGAFEGDALLFGSAYLLVRVLHIALFAAGSDDVDVRQATRALAPTALLAPVLVVGAGALDGAAQLGVWALALGIDFIGGGLRGIEGWKLSPGHFAERHGLIIIIALGESIVAIGVGASELELTVRVVLAATLGMIVAAALWWTYFDDAGERIEHQLRSLRGRARNTMARDAYSFLHLPMVAGIVLLALGVKKTLGDVDDPLELVPAVALCCGTALYFLSQVAFRWRCSDRGYGQRLVAAGACTALTPLATEISALVALGALAVVCAALVAYETRAVLPGRVRGQSPDTSLADG